MAQDVIATVAIPTAANSPSVVGIAVSWVKNGGTPFVKNHAVNIPALGLVYPCSYGTDTGIALNDGDIVSATATTFDIDNLNSTSVASTPLSVTVPSTPPLPPTSVTLALSS